VEGGDPGPGGRYGGSGGVLGFTSEKESDLTQIMRHIRWRYVWFGEVGFAALLAGIFAVPLGIFLAGKAEITLAFIGAVALFFRCSCS